MVGKAATPKEASLTSLKRTRALAAKIPYLTVSAAKALEAVQWVCPMLKGGAIKQCEYVFKNVVDDLNKSIVVVQAGDNVTGATHLSEINVTPCSDAMERLGATLRTNKVLKLFQMQVNNCLALVRP